MVARCWYAMGCSDGGLFPIVCGAHLVPASWSRWSQMLTGAVINIQTPK